MKKFLCLIVMIAQLSALLSCGGGLMPEDTQNSHGEANATSVTAASVTTETTALAQGASEATTEETLPPVEKKPIRAILYYGYKAYLSASGLNGYRFSYHTRTETVTGETKNTPIDQNDPLGTGGIINQKTVAADATAFDALCDDLYALRFDLLPESVEEDPFQAVMDGWHRYIVIYFEDGSVFVSQGYAAESYNARYKQVYNRLTAYNTGN